MFCTLKHGEYALKRSYWTIRSIGRAPSHFETRQPPDGEILLDSLGIESIMRPY